MSTPTQSLWEALQDPGVVPRLDEIITLLQTMARNVGVERLTLSPTGISSGSSSGTKAGQGLAALLPGGTVFTLPETLRRFNELIGATQITGALPTEVVLTNTVAPYSVSSALAYTVPPGKYAVAMGPFIGKFSHHSPGITLNGFINYGLPGQLPVTQPNLPVVEDFTISREVTESHEVTNNLTIVVANNTPLAVDVVFATTFLVIDVDLWESTYSPIFRQAVRAWIQAMAVDAAQIGGQTV